MYLVKRIAKHKLVTIIPCASKIQFNKMSIYTRAETKMENIMNRRYDSDCYENEYI